VLPAEYVSVLRVLMSHAKRSVPTFADDCRTFQEDTGQSVEKAFASFEHTPVASASMAQVYRAALPDGSPVAVKIQHRVVARFLAVDLWTIEIYYDLLARLIPGLRLRWLAVETRRHMTEELDFVAEVQNASRAATLLLPEFSPSELLIPRTFPSLCGPRIITMQWVDGVRLDDAEGLRALNCDVRAIALRLQRIFASLIFVHGFVHAGA